MNHSQLDSELSEPIDDVPEVESDTSSQSSSSDSSDSSYSSDSSEQIGDKTQALDKLELAKITEDVLSLPRGLCENAAIFEEFFSLDTWQLLPEQMRAPLLQYLPQFSHILEPHEAAMEQERTVTLLLTGQLQRFDETPLCQLQRNLEKGNYRPDVKHLRRSIAKSQRREQRFRNCERLSHLAKEMFISREQLLRNAYKAAPDTAVRTERQIRKQHSTILYSDTKLYAVRARKRFYTEMRELVKQYSQQRMPLSADEEDDTDAPGLDELAHDAQLSAFTDYNNSSSGNGKNGLFANVNATPSDKSIYSTHFKRQNQVDDEATVRATQYAQQPRLCNRNFKQYLLEHKRRKLTEPTLPDFETSDIRLRDVCARAQLGGNFKRYFALNKTPGRKPKSKINNGNGPPALVPIQQSQSLLKAPELLSETKAIAGTRTRAAIVPDTAYSQQEQLGVGVDVAMSASSNVGQISPLNDNGKDSFHIMDNDVELQQEEVVATFGHTICEETIPAFVISNDVALPTAASATANADLSTQNMLVQQTSIDAQQSISMEFGMSQNKLPKLEPILSNMVSKHIVKSLESCKSVSSIKLTTQKSSLPTLKSQSTATLSANVASSMVAPPPTPTSTLYAGNSSELIQETHACFFSLIRDFFCATPHHRMKYEELKERIDIWLHNPITALNDWYSLAENWSVLLMSGINFLAGNFTELPDEYVPYIEHKTQLNIYQWIGAGRDSDARLTALCKFWLRRRNEQTQLSTKLSTDSLFDTSTTSLLLRRRSTESEDVGSAYDVNNSGGVTPPPPPRCPTTWTVRAASTDEVAEFQRQERERFEHPYRAYTYRMHGYESVVGPVKGIYSQTMALTKARGHSMMIVNRPNFVTILTLVRDATARLPNGEGTRADISELLKCSQYINRDAAENVLQTIVSGALDRMHTEHDPCVRYDPKRKIWIYLHRGRSETDFERMHQQNQTMSKQQKKPQQRKQKSKSTLLKDGNSVDSVEVAQAFSHIGTSTSNTTTFSLPALVPSNPIIVSSKASQHSQQQQQQQPVLQQQTSPTIVKSLPVPPLKYNIPTQVQQQQQQQQQQQTQSQKSLLKNTLHTQRHNDTVHKSNSSTNAVESNSLFETSATLLTNQRNVLRNNTVANSSTNNNNISSSSSSNNTTVNAGKRFSFTVPQAKSSVTVSGNTTPIIVATPGGLQTVHVAHSGSSISAGNVIQQQQQQHQQHTQMLAGEKRITINKPLIINQIATSQTSQQQIQTQQLQQHPPSQIAVTKLIKTPQVVKQQQSHQQMQHQAQQPQQQQSFILPINVSHVDATRTRSSETIQQTHQNKNIIRLVPSTPNVIGANTQVKVAGTNAGKQQTVQILGQRVVANITMRPPTQQQQKHITGSLPSGISIVGNNVSTASIGQTQTTAPVTTVNSVITPTTSNTILKMSPQAFASLQQKHNVAGGVGSQHILVRQASTNTGATTTQAQTQQRVVVGNTAIIAQSMQGGIKNIVVQPKSIAGNVITSTQKAGIVTNASSNVATTTTAMTAPSTVHKVQSINATNLTPQQQRILLQNLKQQQQNQQQHQQQQQQQQHQVQFKTVQVVTNPAHHQQQQQKTEQTKPHFVNVTTAQQHQQHQQQQQHRVQQPTLLQTTKQIGGKTVAVVMSSQPQGLTRILKANANVQQQQQIPTNVVVSEAASGTRVVTSSTGQIISLETLLQKQGGALRIANARDGKTLTTVGQPGNTKLIQLATSSAQTGGDTSVSAPTQYAVVSQPRNIISIGTPHRLVTTQALNTPVTIASTTHSTVQQAKEGVLNAIANAQQHIQQQQQQHHQQHHHQQQQPQQQFTKVSTVTGTGTSTANRIIVPQMLSSNNTTGTAKIIGRGNIISGHANATGTANTTTNLNVTNIQGKQVVFAAKPMTTVGNKLVATLPASSQAQQLSNVIIGTPTVKLQQTKAQQVNKTGVGVIGVQHPNSSQIQTVIMGNQILRVQQLPTQTSKAQAQLQQNRASVSTAGNTVATSPGTIVVNHNEAATGGNQPKTIVLGTATGQPIRLQQAMPAPHTEVGGVTRNIAVQQTNTGNVKTAPASRVVLAVQGGSPIFLTPNFQGNTLNLKSLQNMRVVPLTTQTLLNTKDFDAQQQQQHQQQQHQQGRSTPNPVTKIVTQQSVLKNASSK